MPAPLDLSDTDTNLLAIERAAVRGWPGLETHEIDGWLARYSSGGSTRANSVAALDWNGGDIAQSLARVEAFYRDRGAIPRFTISDARAPANLDAELERRGWHRGYAHVTMAKDLTPPSAAREANGITVHLSNAPDADWRAIYLSGLTEDRGPVAEQLVAGIPPPLAFLTARRDGAAIASGLTKIDGPLASVQCMATCVAARRTGAASAILAAIEANVAAHGVRRLYLQADGANDAALALYRRSGFSEIGRYHTRSLQP